MSPEQHAFQALRDWLNQTILGQPHLVDRLLIALLADGHLLVEGPPGLAKTRAIGALSKGVEADFHRIQFTPDLLPADITGTDIYRPQTGEFVFQKGPIFHNLVLADEINRAPAKVQSALLEAMAERQVSVGQTSYALPELFLVMATQNPLEQEGTYPLPEAQLDRFLMHVKVDYPSLEHERAILRLSRSEARQDPQPQAPQVTQTTLFDARDTLLHLHMAEPVETYLVQLIGATRNKPQTLAAGASPRGTLSLDRAARAHAWLNGRDYVGPDNIQAVFHDVLRHRLLLTFEAEAEGQSADSLLDEILNQTPAL
jgi:MoxR-like ATPase